MWDKLLKTSVAEGLEIRTDGRGRLFIRDDGPLPDGAGEWLKPRLRMDATGDLLVKTRIPGCERADAFMWVPVVLIPADRAVDGEEVLDWVDVLENVWKLGWWAEHVDPKSGWTWNRGPYVFNFSDHSTGRHARISIVLDGETLDVFKRDAWKGGGYSTGDNRQGYLVSGPWVEKLEDARRALSMQIRQHQLDEAHKGLRTTGEAYDAEQKRLAKFRAEFAKPNPILSAPPPDRDKAIRCRNCGKACGYLVGSEGLCVDCSPL